MGVEPRSPPRDEAKWLSSRLSPSVEMRRRYGWLRMVPRCAPLPSPYLVPFGRWRHVRGREHFAESLEALCWVGTQQGGGKLDHR